jgi:hypothetical protein
MTNNQENKRAMYFAVWILLIANAVKLAIVPLFAQALALLGTLLSDIKAKEKERGEMTTGKMEARDTAEAAVIAAVIPVASALSAYAGDTGNTELKEKSKVKISILEHMRDLDLIDKVRSILGLAQDHAADLVPYGITPEIITALEETLAAFDTAVAGLGKGKTEKTGARTSLNALFDQTDDLLKNKIDQMMEVVRLKEPQLGVSYDAARVIHDIGGGHNASPPVPIPPAAPQASPAK